MGYNRGKVGLTMPESIVFILAGVNKIAEYSIRVNELVDPLKRDKRLEYEQKEHERNERKKLLQAYRRLEKAEEITFNTSKGEYQLTPAGWLKFVYYYNKHNLGNKNGVKGDYVIMFDIPEKHRRFRDVFRECLKNLGCEYIQKSVFYSNNKDVFVFAQKVVVNCELSEYVRFVCAKEIF